MLRGNHARKLQAGGYRFASYDRPYSGGSGRFDSAACLLGRRGLFERRSQRRILDRNQPQKYGRLQVEQAIEGCAERRLRRDKRNIKRGYFKGTANDRRRIFTRTRIGQTVLRGNFPVERSAQDIAYCLHLRVDEHRDNGMHSSKLESESRSCFRRGELRFIPLESEKKVFGHRDILRGGLFERVFG